MPHYAIHDFEPTCKSLFHVVFGINSFEPMIFHTTQHTPRSPAHHERVVVNGSRQPHNHQSVVRVHRGRIGLLRMNHEVHVVAQRFTWERNALDRHLVITQVFVDFEPNEKALRVAWNVQNFNSALRCYFLRFGRVHPTNPTTV